MLLYPPRAARAAALPAYPGTRAEARCRPAGGAVAARHRWRRSSPSLISVNWPWARAAASAASAAMHAASAAASAAVSAAAVVAAAARPAEQG